MEIQKAEEFADDYREKMVSAFCWSMEKDSAMVTDLIKRVRARDKAIIERCKEVASFYGADKSQLIQLDCVLCDLA